MRIYLYTTTVVLLEIPMPAVVLTFFDLKIEIRATEVNKYENLQRLLLETLFVRSKRNACTIQRNDGVLSVVLKQI